MPQLVMPEFRELIAMLSPIFLIMVAIYPFLPRKHPLKQVAPLLGFEYRKSWFGPGRMLGEFEGVHFDIRNEAVAFDGPDFESYIVFRAELGENVPEGLVVVPEQAIRSQNESIWPEVNAAVRSRKVGLPYLEEVCSIWGDDLDEVRRYLSRPGIEDFLLDLIESAPCAYIKEGQLIYYEPGTGEYDFEYDAPLERLVEAVRVLDGREG